MASRGRRSKLTPLVQEILVRAVRAGKTYRLACRAANIDESTLRQWIARGEGRHKRRAAPEYVALVAVMKKAESDRAEEALETIRAAAKEHWQAAAWFLERRYPLDYGRMIRREPEREKAEEGITIIYNRPAPDPTIASDPLQDDRSGNGKGNGSGGNGDLEK